MLTVIFIVVICLEYFLLNYNFFNKKIEGRIELKFIEDKIAAEDTQRKVSTRWDIICRI